MDKKKEIPFFNFANAISIARVLLLPVYILILLYGDIFLKNLAILLCLIIFFMDFLDGWVAVKFNLKTKIGSHVDVIADRITELSFWLFFLSLGLVPLWAPLIVISRGMITDLIRAQALMKQKGTYDMIKTKTGKLIVSSRAMRGFYGISKMMLFMFLTASLTINSQLIHDIISPLIVLVVITCVLRGIPVINEGWKYLK
ncbi:MAG: CDP-alcohol phosphatidyltransferase family protein [Candidatus Aenigmarchaeota archaeon]|nr:CDP-alcohol phosphatidyltransferase family protein [Candidatus Aenigmarchaeota archaeon]